MTAFQIFCPTCDQKIPSEHINIVEMIGKCAACDHVFTIDKPSDVGRDMSLEGPPSRPSGIRLENAGIDVKIIISWFHPGLFFLLFFCICWDGFLVFWYSIALFGTGEGAFDWMMIWFPILHVAVGVGLTYSVACGFINRTILTISNYDLSVKRGPLPWFGNRSIPRKEILEIEQSGENQVTISAHHQDSRQIVLISGLDQNQAQYVGWQTATAANVPLVQRNSPNSGQGEPPQWLQNMIQKRIKRK